jgi:predicted acyl esterase
LRIYAPFGEARRACDVPMRDGVRLSVHLYTPPRDGAWPGLLQQIYGNPSGSGRAMRRLASHGYVVAMQNFRGCQRSEGTYQGYRALGFGELQDGFDTVEWLAALPQCDGKVGTMGGSQAGFAQNFTAVAAPPSLVCQYMSNTGLSLFEEGYRLGGLTRYERFQTAMTSACRDPADNAKLIQEWSEHPDKDDYWMQEDCTPHFDRMNVPCFTQVRTFLNNTLRDLSTHNTVQTANATLMMFVGILV